MTVHKQGLWIDMHAGLHGPAENMSVVQHSAGGSAQAATVGADLETAQHWIQVLLVDPDTAAAAPTCKM